jgi:hypothetical protein
MKPAMKTLRSHMIGSTAAIAHRGIGLALLLHTGVPGWLRAVGPCVSVSHAESTTIGRDRPSSASG